MLGAIIGDIVGSVYEWNNIKHRNFPLFVSECDFTDDTVMTLAVAEALMAGGTAEDYVRAMRRLGRAYPNRGYGGRFNEWLEEETPAPYHSWGNGSAMRVAPVAWAFDTLEQVQQAAAESAAVTHDHPEGIRGAQATATAIFLARKGATKQEIRDAIENTYAYDLHRTLDEIRPQYLFNESCQQTVPEALIAFLESDSFEDTLRNAVSLGGDSDTLTAIAASVAEGAYGIPQAIRQEALARLTPELTALYEQFEVWIREREARRA